MAGMEQLQVHSKSYLLRWIEARSEHVISWSIQPQKKGLNFGIFKHPGAKLAPTPRVGTISSPEIDGGPPEHTPGPEAQDGAHRSLAIEKLKSLGYKKIMWYGYCEPNQITTGTYEVPSGEGGMYALVLDNTFGKSYSKLANLALLMYPVAGGVSQSNLSVRPGNDRRMSSMHKPSVDIRPGTSSGRQPSVDGTTDANVFEGMLLKRRRKRGQGYARRYFSLDLDSSALAYYHDQKSSSIRGIIPLSLAAVATNEKTREISIDSGAEVWLLRAATAREFDGWKHAIESASKVRNESLSPTPRKSQPLVRALSSLQSQVTDSIELMKTEEITKRLEHVRNAARQIAKDTDPKYFSPRGSPSVSRTGSDLQKMDSESEKGVSAPGTEDSTPMHEKKSFWGRKSSRPKPSTTGSSSNQRSVSASSAVPSVNSLGISSEDLRKPPKSPVISFPSELDGVHEQCLTLYRNIDSIVHDLQALVAESKARKPPVLAPSIPAHMMEVASRLSMESSFSQEFFDAEMGDLPMLTIQRDENECEPSILVNGSQHSEEGSASEIEEDEGYVDRSSLSEDRVAVLFPTKPKNLNIADQPAIVRRTAVDAPTVLPPSLIGFLRKNVGKDLSTVSMPVSANEPLSLTQKAAEMMEYSELLDQAADASLSKSQRLLLVTAFAISSLAALRVKERAIRKPFNPMLGETFEMIREDKGYRFLAEKVSHRPVVLACQADSDRGWSISHSAAPTQKFWGKSAELITDGRVRLVLHATGEHYSWAPATCFLRNIIAGEKYIEPVGTQTVTCDTTGHRAEIVFKAKGMFSGRSEEVSASLLDAYGDALPEGLEGKWTSSLVPTDRNNNGGQQTSSSHQQQQQQHARPLWAANDLPPNAARCYGFTAFAASLNELSARDRPHAAPTDSRRRPDQRALEDRDVDAAEELKAGLEEAQRRRRREMEDAGASWTPAWFAKIQDAGEGEEVWKLKTGKDGYWEHRAKDDWKAVTNVLEV